MLRNTTQLSGFVVHATDGELGYKRRSENRPVNAA